MAADTPAIPQALEGRQADPQAHSIPPAWKKDTIPPLSDEEREKLYKRLRINIPEAMQKEHRWILIHDKGKHCKMPIGGHPSATMNLEQAIAAHKARKNNIDAIGYSTGGQMRREPYRTIPPDPNCIWLDYDDLKDGDGKTIAAPEIVAEIEQLRKFGAYVEISGSGKGIHVCIPKPDYYDAECKGVIRKSHQPEIFGNGQYVKVTGNLVDGCLPDWEKFSGSEEARNLIRSIITREGGFRLNQEEKESGASSRSNGSSGSDYEPLDMSPVDWPDKFRAVENVNNYVAQHWPVKKITDPSAAAYGICFHIMEYLERNDPDHQTPRHINTVFMECKRFPALYGEKGLHHKNHPEDPTNGWSERQASRKIADIIQKHNQRSRIKGSLAEIQQGQIRRENEAISKRSQDETSEVETKNERREYTLAECAKKIARQRERYLFGVSKSKKGKVYVGFDREEFVVLWSRLIHAVAIRESKSAFAYFNGVKWQVDENGRGIKGAIDQCIELVCKDSKETYAKLLEIPIHAMRDVLSDEMHKNTTPQFVAAQRSGEASISIPDIYKRGMTCTDGVILIDTTGIHITQHNPEKDVWFGGVPTSINDLLPNLTSMSLDEVVNRFPNFREALEACGEDKVQLMATLAGIAVYYLMPNHKPLEAWYYLYDNTQGGTGKSTHMRMFNSMFGEYMAMGISWNTFTGKNIQNGSFLGKVGVECEEACVNDVEDAEKIKAFSSGGWELKILYSNPTPCSQPLLMISLANVKPLLTSAANKAPVFQRLQPVEFTVTHRNTGVAFPCDEEEYREALLNVGCWVAYDLMKKGDAACKKDLPFYVTPEEVETLCRRVPWRNLIPEIGMWEAGHKESVKAARAAILDELHQQGWTDEDLKGAPELRNEKSFREAIDGFALPKYDESGPYKYERGKGSLKISRPSSKDADATRQSRYWITNYRLKKGVHAANLTHPKRQEESKSPQPQSAEERTVKGQYYVYDRTRAVMKITSDTEEATGWDVTKYIQQKDPYPQHPHSKALGELLIKDAVFRLHGNKLISIEV